MNRIKKFVSVLLSFNIIILSFLIIDVYADTIKSGNLGKDENKDSVIWNLNDEGDLTISGSGEMKCFPNHYSFDGNYNNIRNVIIEEGIVNIGSYVFSMCEKMSTISIPLSMKEIGEYAFADATSLKNVFYEGTKEQWDEIEIAPEGNSCLLNAKINHKEEPHICSFHTVVNTIPPTCVADGIETRECSCGNKNTTTIPATGIHIFEWSVSVEATCTTDGEEKQHCTVCNALGETRKVNKTGHIFSEWKTTIKETEEHDGEEARTCKSCGFTETRVIDNIQSNDGNILGDADSDGKVSAKDARLVLQVVAGLKENKELNFTNADVNKDKYITAVDARFILQVVAGLK